MKRNVALVILLGGVALYVAAQAQGQSAPRYVYDPGWPKLMPNKWKIGGITGLAAIGWYLWLQTTWLASHLNISVPRALQLPLWTSLKAVAIIVAIALVLIF